VVAINNLARSSGESLCVANAQVTTAA